MELKKITDDFSVSPQLSLDLIGQAARLGFTKIINARPDNEEPGQITSDELANAAAANGLTYVHIPVIPGEISDADVAAFTHALQASPGPALSFCRTGMRAVHLWAMSAAAQRSAQEVLDMTAAAGLDITDLTPRLEALSQAV